MTDPIYVSQHNTVTRIDPRTGQELHYRHGQAVPDFAAWPEHARKTLLSLGWVKPASECPEPYEVPTITMPAPQHAAVDIEREAFEAQVTSIGDRIVNQGGPIREAPCVASPEVPHAYEMLAQPLPQLEEGQFIALADGTSYTVQADDLPPPIEVEVTAPVVPDAAEDGVSVECPHCPGSQFKGLHGLKIHLSRNHKR